MDFTVPMEQRQKLKESEDIDKYLDLARELKKLWNMRVMVVPIVSGELGKMNGRTENRRKNQHHQDCNYVKIG